jgi:carbamoyl-phosphate synthase large subunit
VPHSKDMNLLFTSSGRRVALIRMFAACLATGPIRGRALTADKRADSPTASISDGHRLVPPVTDPSYVDELLRICKDEDIRGIIPLIDTELPVLAANKALFADHDVEVLVSSPAVVALGCDKMLAHEFFTTNNIPTPLLHSQATSGRFPLIVKPRDGSAGIGVTKVRNEKELAFFRDYVPNAMVQEFVEGEEFTVDVLADLQGNIRTIVPRQRIEVRAGEVSKGVTRKDPAIIAAVADAVSKLSGVVGCINLQCFRTPAGELSFIEINPRFGGGAPLSVIAGADLPRWTIEMLAGATFDGLDQSWQDGLAMLRYDDAVFVSGF